MHHISMRHSAGKYLSSFGWKFGLKLFLLGVLHFQVLSFCLHDGECSSNVVGERDIVYKPKKILALKDIDPEERMNMVKAIVNPSNIYRDGTYCGTVVRYLGTVPTVLHLGAKVAMHRSQWALFTGVHAKKTFRPS